MTELEELGQRYLFKLRTWPGSSVSSSASGDTGTGRMSDRGLMWWKANFSCRAGALRDGWWYCAVESKKIWWLRRVARGTDHFVDRSDKVKVWEYVVLVTNTDYALEAMGQLYRDRADCENGLMN